MTKREEAKEIAKKITSKNTSKSDYFDGGSDEDPIKVIEQSCNGDVELCNLVYDLIFNPAICD